MALNVLSTSAPNISHLHRLTNHRKLPDLNYSYQTTARRINGMDLLLFTNGEHLTHVALSCLFTHRRSQPCIV